MKLSLKAAPVSGGDQSGNKALSVAAMARQAQPGASLEPGLPFHTPGSDRTPLCRCRRLWMANPQICLSQIPFGLSVNPLALALPGSHELVEGRTEPEG